jgi:tetratricopeptide (TPR) repeat protein
MSQLIVSSEAVMGPLEVSVYPPDGDPIEFVLSSGQTEKSLSASPGRYAVVARRPNGTRLSKSVSVKDKDETVDLSAAVGQSPNEFMAVETKRGQVARDPMAPPQSPWHATLTGAAGSSLDTALTGAAEAALGTPIPMVGTPLASPELMADGLKALWEKRGQEKLALRLWRLDESDWSGVGVDAATAVWNSIEVSGDFVKIGLQPRGVPLSLGLIGTDGFGPVVNVPPYAEGVEITFLAKSVLIRAADRTVTPGGQRIPVACVTPNNQAAADLLSALAAPGTPPAVAIWEQALPRLLPGENAAPQMLMDKFERPAEALLAAHYLLRFLPDYLSVSWADNLVHAVPEAADGPVIATWARILKRPADVTDAEVDLAIDSNVALALKRPITLFAHTRMLLFDALCLTSEEIAAEGRDREGAFRRFGAEAGGLECFWGGGPDLPGVGSDNPLAENLALIYVIDGAFTEEPHAGRLRVIKETVRRNPESADGWSQLATILAADDLERWNGARENPQTAKDIMRRAEEALQEAMKLDPSIAQVHLANGFIRRAKGDHQGALDAFDRALQLEPNFARAYTQKANQLVLLGRPQEAPPLVSKAIALSPSDPHIGEFHWVIGRAYFLMKDYENAIVWLRMAVELTPNLWFSRAYLLSAYALTGRQVETDTALSEFMTRFSRYANLERIREIYDEEAYDPVFRTGLEELYKGLRLAGVH